jgi:hypothetical protein
MKVFLCSEQAAQFEVMTVPVGKEGPLCLQNSSNWAGGKNTDSQNEIPQIEQVVATFCSFLDSQASIFVFPNKVQSTLHSHRFSICGFKLTKNGKYF